MASEETLDMAPLDEILDEFKDQKGAVIPILQRAQEIYGYFPKEVLQYISKKTGVPQSQIFGVATFYAQFYLKRRGRHIVRQCDGTACHVRGAARIISTIEDELEHQERRDNARLQGDLRSGVLPGFVRSGPGGGDRRQGGGQPGAGEDAGDRARLGISARAVAAHSRHPAEFGRGWRVAR